MLYFVYAARVVEMVGANFRVFLVAVITSNAILEAVVAAILTLPVVVAFKKINKN
jgi:uncharacterized membrane protein